MKNGGFWVAAIIGIVLDRLTKWWVVGTMDLHESLPFIPGVLRFTYIENPGAAWSFFRESGGFLKWISLAVAVVLVAMALFGGRMRRWEQVGYGCLLAGAVGNGVDRFMAGAVVDFLEFVPIHFPIFNLADVAINIGVIFLLVGTIFGPHPEESESESKSTNLLENPETKTEQ